VAGRAAAGVQLAAGAGAVDIELGGLAHVLRAEVVDDLGRK
jgi:hypothetical protein